MAEPNSPHGSAPSNTSPEQTPTKAGQAHQATLAQTASLPNSSTAVSTPPRLAVGSQLDAYELIEKLGEGGMGTVWKARHVKLDKFVALKVLPPHLTQDPEAVQRFEREMRAVGKLEHPHVVRAMDAREIGGLHFLVMEYVEGTQIEIRARPKSQSATTPPQRRNPWVLAAAGGAAFALVLLGVIVIKIVNKDGTTTEIRLPEGSSVEVQKDGKIVAKVDDTKGATKTVSSNPPSASPSTNSPPLAVAPFDAAKARAHQAACAKHLGVPVEFTNSLGMKFMLIPPGEFTMGMTKEEAETIAAQNPNDELWKTMSLSSAPPHRVRLTQAFYVGTYEVTQQQYEKVVGVNPSHFSAKGEGKELVKDEDPQQHSVEMVSFIDAAEFCIKLSQQEMLKPVYFSANNVITLLPGNGYRLPTEAEWEWACRAGTSTSWSHGEQESALGTVAWFGGNSGGRTHAVGELKANPFGLYDMHGNVWEWCQDWHDVYAQGDVIEDPQGPDAGSARVLRGGDWDDHTSRCRSAFRVARGVGFPNYRVGFRVLVGVSVSRSSR